MERVSDILCKIELTLSVGMVNYTLQGRSNMKYLLVTEDALGGRNETIVASLKAGIAFIEESSKLLNLDLDDYVEKENVHFFEFHKVGESMQLFATLFPLEDV
jgi:hypothetical protein